jgi:hypothetical protein
MIIMMVLLLLLVKFPLCSPGRHMEEQRLNQLLLIFGEDGDEWSDTLWIGGPQRRSGAFDDSDDHDHDR